MKTKAQLLDELNDTLTMLNDAVKVQNWTIAIGAASHAKALSLRLRSGQWSAATALCDVKDSLSKLGALLHKSNINECFGAAVQDALLEQGSANVDHV